MLVLPLGRDLSRFEAKPPNYTGQIQPDLRVGSKESETHRGVEVGRDLWDLLVQPLLKQGHPKQVAQGHAQVAFEDLGGGSPSN